MKKLLKIGAVLLAFVILVVGIGFWWVFHNLDSIAKDQIQTAGTHALGVNTTVDAVHVHVWDGNLALSGLNIANPSGYTGKHFLNLKKGDLDVTLSSLRDDTINVPKLTLKGIDVSIEETSAGANYQTILDNISKNKGSAPPTTTPEKKLIIGDLVIENTTIHVDLQGGPTLVGKVVNPNTSITLPIDRIELHNVGKTGSGVGGTGVTTSELSRIVVQAVMAAAVEKGQGMIPDLILGDIKGRVGAIGDLAQFPVEVVGKLGEGVTQIGQKAAEEVGKAADDIGKKIGGGISNLLGNDKDNKKTPPPKKP